MRAGTKVPLLIEKSVLCFGMFSPQTSLSTADVVIWGSVFGVLHGRETSKGKSIVINAVFFTSQYWVSNTGSIQVNSLRGV